MNCTQKAFECEQQKGFFPYEYIDTVEKLNETNLSPHSAFYNSLTATNISSEEYEYCQGVWEENKMASLADFLRWYSFLNVKPFLEAIEKQSRIYQLKNIDMLKEAISLPGLAVRWKFAEINNDGNDISLISNKNSNLYTAVKRNIVGGPSIVFH